MPNLCELTNAELSNFLLNICDDCELASRTERVKLGEVLAEMVRRRDSFNSEVIREVATALICS